MNENDRAKLLKLAQEATEGPWRRAYDTILTSTPPWMALAEVFEERDSKFVQALNPKVVIELLSYIDKLEDEVDELKAIDVDTVWHFNKVVDERNEMREVLETARDALLAAKIREDQYVIKIAELKAALIELKPKRKRWKFWRRG